MRRVFSACARLCAFAIVAACSAGRDAGGASTDTQAAHPVVRPTADAPAAAQPESFEQFWLAFRQAVVEGNKEKIASMTRFPFETRGTMDDDPVRTHDRSSFLGILNRLLADDAGTTAKVETMRSYIERMTTLTERNFAPGASEARVGNFTFARTNGRWLFTRAYLDE